MAGDLPEGFEDRFAAVFGSRGELHRQLADAPRPAVRVNRLRAPDPAGLLARLEDEGVARERVPWWRDAAAWVDPDAAVGNRREHTLGYLYSMGAASLLPALALDPQPGEAVLDLAAAPGSKTGLLAERMGNEGLLVANDPNEGRAFHLIANLQRLGVTHDVVTVADGRHLPALPQVGGGFDRVLVDAPCTNVGSATLERAPTGWHPDRAEGLSALQRSLCDRAVQLARPGGVVVYSTCTLDPLENEAVVDHVLREHPVDVEPWRPEGLDAADPLPSFRGTRFHPDVADALRVHPAAHGTEGFFLARFRKREGPAA